MIKRRLVFLSLVTLILLGGMSLVCISLFLPALTRSVRSSDLGRVSNWDLMGTTFDNVHWGRGALNASIARSRVILEPTPCDGASACGALASASVTVTAPLLGVLEPTPGLLPSGTISVTLSLTTTALANCRWSEQADTSYHGMPHDFQQGQGTKLHSTVVSGLYGPDERWFYVRCQDMSTGHDPNDYERQTRLRVLGPWEDGYPRIANLWGHYDPKFGAGFFAGYDLYIPFWWRDPANQATAIRSINPNAKILLTQNATYGWPQLDPLTTEWWNSSPGDPGYNCLLRDSHGGILLVKYWGHPMYNMTVPYCRMVLAQQNVDAFLSPRPDQGDNLAYDGIFWDLLHDTISWLGDDIDSDLDGQPDDPNTLDAAYRAGVEDFLTQVRTRLPYAILMGNEAPQTYAPWINGRLVEWQLSAILDGADSLTWDAVVNSYRDWASRGHTPHITFIQTKPEAIYAEKFPFQHSGQVPLAMQAEAAASYQRMRYGLTSALMGDGLFSYDLREVDGPLWWYDEFGAPGDGRATTLPPRGYLGQPTSEPMLLVNTLDTPDQVANGRFEDGLNGWGWWVDSGAGAAATLTIDATGGVSGTAAAHIVVTSAAEPWAILLSQPSKTTVAGQSYTLSFWARSDVTRTIYAKTTKETPPGTNYGFNVQALVTPQWQHFHLWDDTSVTANDGELDLQVGEGIGELWLDDVQFQAGALGVWARPFSNGLAVINTTKETQTVPLPGVYCKLNGSQAPLFQVRIDDDKALVSAGWSEQAANDNQFGATVQVASASTRAAVTYTPTLAYSGTYEVLAWVVPTTTQSSAVSVTVRHAQGEAVVLLDETAGEIGWRSLGTYTFNAGKSGSATLVTTGDGTVVADAFKWVGTARYNDGSRVSQITLQPQDGIVLLSSCYEPAGRVYSPLVMHNWVDVQNRTGYLQESWVPTLRNSLSFCQSDVDR
jgi:hypothetical protein